MKASRSLTFLLPVAVIAACSETSEPMTPAFAVTASSNTVTFTGQGLIADGFGGIDLRTELCGTANGAEVDGPYLLFVLTATKATSASISINGQTFPMVKFGNGTFKYVAGWTDPDDLINNVSATYDGSAKNAQLVLSHGCRPYTQGAWCSPGFWQNAADAAWALTGHSKSEYFNTSVYDYFYGATYAADPTLYTVLTTKGGTYKGAGVAGTSGHVLNAFNAVGAFLTNNLPGYQFDYDLLLAAQAGASEMCPIDHFGNFK